MTRIRIQPKLNHPIWTVIELLDREGSMLMDEDAREPVYGPKSTFYKTITIPAQISTQDTDMAVAEDTGIRETSRGHIICRVVDMEKIIGPGMRLKRGDRIIKIGFEDVDLYIIGHRSFAHWPHLGGAMLVMYYFSDRHPTSQTGNL